MNAKVVINTRKYFPSPSLAAIDAFVDRLPAEAVAERFGYSAGYVRLLRHQFTTGKFDFSEPVPEGGSSRYRVTAETRRKIRIELDKPEWDGLKSKFLTSTKGGKVKLPSAFPEKGLYMLATILKSPQAVQATLAIIETFAKIRQLSRSIQELSIVKDKADQKALMQRSGELIAGIFDDDLQTSGTETSIELNFAVLKFKHTIKKKK